MGSLLALLSAIFSSSKDLVSKGVADKVDSTVSTFASFVFALPFYAVLLTVLYLSGHEKFVVVEGFFFYVLLRSITDVAAEWCKMKALSQGDLSLIAPFISLSPLFVLILSPFLTNDSLTLLGTVGVIIVTIGGFVAAGGTVAAFKNALNKGVLLGLCASLCFGLNSCFDKLAVQHASPVVSAATMTALAAVFLIPPFFFIPKGVSQLASQYKLFFLRGLLEILFMVVKLYALLTLPAAYVAAFLKISMFISIIAAGVLFGEKNTAQRLKGGAIVFVGILAIVSSF